MWPGRSQVRVRRFASALLVAALAACGEDSQALVDLTDEEFEALCAEYDDAVLADELARRGECVRRGVLRTLYSPRRGEPDYDAVADCEAVQEPCLTMSEPNVCTGWVRDDCSATVADLEDCAALLHELWREHGDKTCEEATTMVTGLQMDGEKSPCAFRESCLEPRINAEGHVITP